MQPKTNNFSPNLSNEAMMQRDKAISGIGNDNYKLQQFQHLNFMNQLLNQGANKNAFDTDSQISNLSAMGRNTLQ